MSPSKSLFWLCLSFVIGIAFQSVFNIGRSYYVIGFLVLGAFVLISYVFFKKNILIVLGFCFLFIALGIARFQITQFAIENDPVGKFNDRPGNIVLVGQIIGQPDIKDKIQRVKVRIQGTGSIILATLGRYPEYHYLDTIKMTGELKTPAVTDDFNYKNYLLKDGIVSVMDFPKTELVSNEHQYTVFSFLYEKILFFKKIMAKSIDTNFAGPGASILEGIVLGSSKSLDTDLKSKFNAAGLTHIIAVSGSHIVMISAMLVSFLLLLGLWRQQALYVTIFFVWIYIILVGLPPSGVRAGIMGSIFLVAQILGRQNTSSRTIVLAGCLMLLQNPLLLLFDVGFQLSFLASLGIIYIKPLFDRLFTISNALEGKSKVKSFVISKLQYLIDIVSVTFSVQVFALPIMVYNFGNVSLIALLTNLLILPSIPFLMSFGFLSVILGIFSHFLGWVFYLPCWVLLTYFLKVLDVFYQPWALITIPSIALWWFLAYYAALFLVIFYLNKKVKPGPF